MHPRSKIHSMLSVVVCQIILTSLDCMERFSTCFDKDPKSSSKLELELSREPIFSMREITCIGKQTCLLTVETLKEAAGVSKP
jgi:hypothetical protein